MDADGPGTAASLVNGRALERGCQSAFDASVQFAPTSCAIVPGAAWPRTVVTVPVPWPAPAPWSENS